MRTVELERNFTEVIGGGFYILANARKKDTDSVFTEWLRQIYIAKEGA